MRGHQVVALEDEADAVPAQLGQLGLLQLAQVGRRRARTVPELGRSSPEAQCRNVLLPEPEAPMIAVKLPRRNGPG